MRKFKIGTFIKFSVHHECMSGYYKPGKHFKSFYGSYCELVENEVFEVVRVNNMTNCYYLYSHSDDLTIQIKFNLEQYFTIALNKNMNSIWEDLNA